MDIVLKVGNIRFFVGVYLSTLLIFGFPDETKSQDFRFVGTLDNQLVIIDSLSGEVEPHLPIQNIPTDENISDLTFHSGNQIYYCLRSTSSTPALSSIDLKGNYKVIGPLVFEGQQVLLSEAIAYNEKDGKLYVSASLNGGVQTNDFYAEALLEVDPVTAICRYVTEISTDVQYPDIDVMTIQDNHVYFFDGAPPSANFTKIYSLSLDQVSSVSEPDLIYQGNYIPILDFTSTTKELYFTADRSFYKFDFQTKQIVEIGNTHLASAYDGELIKGISKLSICDTLTVDLGPDITICEGETIRLDVSNENASYEWQSGVTSPFYTITQSGTYWVEVSNACISVRDTVNVYFQSVPDINLGEDKFVCSGEEINLDASYPEASFKWQDGSDEATFSVTESGTYWVEVSNACGIKVDSIEVTFDTKTNVMIPNVITPNGDGKNDFFFIDERLSDASIEIYNRWGKLVYRSESYRGEWDGYKLPASIYFYKITDSCSRTYTGWVQIFLQ